MNRLRRRNKRLPLPFPIDFSEVHRNAEKRLGRLRDLIEIDPFVLGLPWAMSPGPNTTHGVPLSEERACVRAERDTPQSRPAAVRPCDRVGQRLEPFTGLRPSGDIRTPGSLNLTLRSPPVGAEPANVGIAAGYSAASSPGIKRRSTSTSHQSGTTFTLSPPSIRPTDKLGEPKTSCGRFCLQDLWSIFPGLRELYPSCKWRCRQAQESSCGTQRRPCRFSTRRTPLWQ